MFVVLLGRVIKCHGRSNHMQDIWLRGGGGELVWSGGDWKLRSSRASRHGALEGMANVLDVYSSRRLLQVLFEVVDE